MYHSRHRFAWILDSFFVLLQRTSIFASKRKNYILINNKYNTTETFITRTHTHLGMKTVGNDQKEAKSLSFSYFFENEIDTILSETNTMPIFR
jgi:hypothetical protein